MRYHTLRKAHSNFLLISDSQVQQKKAQPSKTTDEPETVELKSGVINVLSLPGGRIKNCYDFLPPEKKYSVIILFIGANDCFYKGGKISDRSAKDIAEDLKDLANVLANRAEQVFVLGLPHRHQKTDRTKEVNTLLVNLSKSSDWNFKGVGHYIGKKDVSGDAVHLTQDGLKNLKRLIKTDILKEKFSLEEDKKETTLIECNPNTHRECLCGSYSPC